MFIDTVSLSIISNLSPSQAEHHKDKLKFYKPYFSLIDIIGFVTPRAHVVYKWGFKACIALPAYYYSD